MCFEELPTGLQVGDILTKLEAMGWSLTSHYGYEENGCHRERVEFKKGERVLSRDAANGLLAMSAIYTDAIQLCEKPTNRDLQDLVSSTLELVQEDTRLVNITQLMERFSQPAPSLPDDIRAQGWMVSAHTDYWLNGTLHTFWLFVKDGRVVKGEGRTDAIALNLVREQIGCLLNRIQKEA